MQCATLELQLQASSQEVSQLRAQLASLDFAAHEPSAASPLGNAQAAPEAELAELRTEAQLRQQEVAELQLQLAAAREAVDQVRRMNPTRTL